MKDGVVVEGKIHITGGQKKDIKKVVEESWASGPSMPEFDRNKNIFSSSLSNDDTASNEA